LISEGESKINTRRRVARLDHMNDAKKEYVMVQHWGGDNARGKRGHGG